MPLPAQAGVLQFHVTGGSEPRLVTFFTHTGKLGEWNCPKCSTHPEYQADCKHIIACQIYQQESSVLSELNTLFPVSSPSSFNLYSLWARSRSSFP